MGRRFLVIWAGQLASTLGTGISAFGAAIWVFVETGSLLWLAVLSMMATLPAVMASPLTGWVDRVDRRLVMIGADAGAALVTGVLVSIWLLGDLEPWHLVIGTFVAGFMASFQEPAYTAVIPSLVPTDQLDRANGLVQLGPALGLVAAPGLAGLLLSQFGIGSIFAVDLGSFAIALTATLLTRFKARAVTATDTDGYRMRDAASWLWNRARPAAFLILLMAAINFVLSIFNVGILARGAEIGGEAGAGVAPTVGGIAMVVVSLAIGSRGIPGKRTQVLAAAIVAFGLFVMLAISRESIVVLALGVGLALATAPLVQTIVTTTFHQLVPDSMQGRVFGLRNAVGRSTAPLGALAAGPLAGWSITGAMVVVGLTMVAIGLSVHLIPGIRTLDAAPATSAGD